MSLSNDELKKFWDIANGLRKNLDAAELRASPLRHMSEIEFLPNQDRQDFRAFSSVG